MLSKIKAFWWFITTLWRMKKVIFYKMQYDWNSSIENSIKFQKAVSEFITILENDDEISDEAVDWARSKLLTWI